MKLSFRYPGVICFFLGGGLLAGVLYRVSESWVEANERLRFHVMTGGAKC